MVSARSVFNCRALAMLRETAATSMVCVSRVRRVVAGAVEKDLGLVFQPAEGAGMNHAIAVALVLGAPKRRRLVIIAPAGVAAELRVRRENLPFDLFEFLSRARHGPIKSQNSPARKAKGSVLPQLDNNSWTEMPRSSKRRRMVSSIRLFGQLAPAVTPTVILPAGSQSRGFDLLAPMLIVMADEFVRFHLGGVLDEIGRQFGLAHFGEVRGVGGIVAADDDEQVHRFAQKFFQRVLPVLRRAANGVEKAEMVFNFRLRRIF